jgi:hypothetical protein
MRVMEGVSKGDNSSEIDESIPRPNYTGLRYILKTLKCPEQGW